MQVEFIVNGGVSLILAPDNQMEEELLRGLMKQQNDITEFRSSVVLLNKTFRNGIVIGRKSSDVVNLEIKKEKSDDKTEEETL